MDENTRKQLLAQYHESEHVYSQQQQVQAQASRARDVRKIVLLLIVFCVVAWVLFNVLLAVLDILRGLLPMIGLMLVG